MTISIAILVFAAILPGVQSGDIVLLIADNGKVVIPVQSGSFTYMKANGTEWDSSSGKMTVSYSVEYVLLKASNGRYVCVINYKGRIGAIDKTLTSRSKTRCGIKINGSGDGSTYTLYSTYKNKYWCRSNTDEDQTSIFADKVIIDDTCKFEVLD